MDMAPSPELTVIAAILSDASRVSMVEALLDGRSLTAHELAYGAGITPQTASFHLKKLLNAGLVRVLEQGRHRFFRLASEEITQALRVLMELTPATKGRPGKKSGKRTAKPAARKHNAVCFARTCYGHLAGRMGVAIADEMEKRGYIRRIGDGAFELTTPGADFIDGLGIDREELMKSRRRMASQCLDWSERHPHIGGALGHAITRKLKQRNWIKTQSNTREITITAAGRKGLGELLGIDVGRIEREFYNDR